MSTVPVIVEQMSNCPYIINLFNFLYVPIILFWLGIFRKRNFLSYNYAYILFITRKFDDLHPKKKRKMYPTQISLFAPALHSISRHLKLQMMIRYEKICRSVARLGRDIPAFATESNNQEIEVYPSAVKKIRETILQN